MKVLFLPRWYPSRDNPYEGVFVREQARAARAAGVEVAVLHIPDLSAPVRGLWRLEAEADPAVTEGIPTHQLLSRPIHVPGSRRLTFWLSYWLHLRAVTQAVRQMSAEGFEPDLLHAHVYSAGAVAAAVGKRLGVPVIVSEHASALPRQLLSKGTLKRARSAYLQADRVLPVSVCLKEAIEAYGIEARFEVVPNAVDTSLFHPDATRARSGQTVRMIFVGSLRPTHHKGFPTLVEALQLLSRRRTNWRLDVVGDGPERPAYESLIQGQGLGSQVAFHGSLPKARIAEMMRDSDLFVMPSDFETQSCVILEAMCSGIPIVSTAVGGIPEIVSPADGILVPPRDPVALAQALDRVMSDPGQWDGRAIAARAAARFGLAAVGAQLVSIYSDVVASHGGAARTASVAEA